MKNAALMAGDTVVVDGAWLARILSVRGSWATVEERGTSRRDEYQLSRLVLAK